MNLELNGLSMGLGTVYHVEQPVSGLEKAPIRTSSSDFAGRDGGYISAQFYGRRQISIKGQILSGASGTHETNRKTLESALPINELVDAKFTMPSGDVFYASCSVVKFDMDYDHPTASRYKIELLCPDHFIYSGDGGSVTPGTGITVSSTGLIGYTVDKLDTSGFILPVILPVVSTIEGYTVVPNDGDLPLKPVIRLSGRYTNPRIYNMTNQSVIEVEYTTSASDVMLIDMYNETITVNGVSILPYKTTLGGFWALEPGNNSLYLETDSGSDQSSCIVEYRHTYSGV